MSELTEQEMAHDRRAEELANSMKQEIGNFYEFVQNDLGRTEKVMDKIFKLLSAGNNSYTAGVDREFVGRVLANAYESWCDAKAFELTRD